MEILWGAAGHQWLQTADRAVTLCHLVFAIAWSVRSVWRGICWASVLTVMGPTSCHWQTEFRKNGRCTAPARSHPRAAGGPGTSWSYMRLQIQLTLAGMVRLKKIAEVERKTTFSD